MRCLDRLDMTGLRGAFWPPLHGCHLELVERSFFYLSFSRSLREKDQKRGATPKAPFKGGCKRESRTTDDSRAFLVSRDTRYSLLHPCCRRPLERDSQVRDGVFVGWRMRTILAQGRRVENFVLVES